MSLGYFVGSIAGRICMDKVVAERPTAIHLLILASGSRAVRIYFDTGGTFTTIIITSNR